MQGNRRADQTVTKIKVVYRRPVDRRLGRTEYRARTSTPLRIVRLAADLRNYRVHRNGQSGSAPPARVRSSADSPLCGGGPLGSVPRSAKRQRNRILGRSEMLSSYPERRLWWVPRHGYLHLRSHTPRAHHSGDIRCSYMQSPIPAFVRIAIALSRSGTNLGSSSALVQGWCRYRD